MLLAVVKYDIWSFRFRGQVFWIVALWISTSLLLSELPSYLFSKEIGFFSSYQYSIRTISNTLSITKRMLRNDRKFARQLAFTGHMAVATEVTWTQVGALGEGNQNQWMAWTQLSDLIYFIFTPYLFLHCLHQHYPNLNPILDVGLRDCSLFPLMGRVWKLNSLHRFIRIHSLFHLISLQNRQNPFFTLNS